MQYEVVLVRIREGEKVAYFSTKDLPAPVTAGSAGLPAPSNAAQASPPAVPGSAAQITPPASQEIKPQAPLAAADAGQSISPVENVPKTSDSAAPAEKSFLGEPLDRSFRKKAKIGEYVIIEAERGREYGQVIAEPELVSESEIEAPLRKVIRIATKEDLHQIEENKKETREALNVCEKKIAEHNLSMKLVSAEYTFDRSKFIFYFIADGRVDFRELVKDLARHFKARIELRQIGVRDEAKMFGGYGPCGRILCCKSFLKDFEPVTVRMAKDQNLPLNPSKISGLCGRLMCCLGYEYKVYKELIKEMPKVGDVIQIKEGKARVLNINPIKRTVLVEVGEDARQIEVPYPLK